jgi:hypothetical protein
LPFPIVIPSDNIHCSRCCDSLDVDRFPSNIEHHLASVSGHRLTAGTRYRYWVERNISQVRGFLKHLLQTSEMCGFALIVRYSLFQFHRGIADYTEEDCHGKETAFGAIVRVNVI